MFLIVLYLHSQPGSEFDVLLIIFDRSQGVKEGACILSTFKLDSIENSVYVKARQLKDIQHVLQGVSHVLHIHGYPQTELVLQDDCLSLIGMISRDEIVPIEPSSWVQIKKRGQLNGKLALVKSLNLQAGSIVVTLLLQSTGCRLLQKKRIITPKSFELQELTLDLTHLSIVCVNALAHKLDLFR